MISFEGTANSNSKALIRVNNKAFILEKRNLGCLRGGARKLQDLLNEGKAISNTGTGTTEEGHHVTPYTRDSSCRLGNMLPSFRPEQRNCDQ
jgi:hypothetical protein